MRVGVQIKLDAAFAKVTTTAYDHGDGSDYSGDNETERVYYN